MTGEAPLVHLNCGNLTNDGGELAAEVDCYMNVDPDGHWLVYSHVAIRARSRL